jgi:DNA repair photolyase
MPSTLSQRPLPPVASEQSMLVVPPKGRGTGWSIAHRFTVEQHESFDDGWGTLDQAVVEEGTEGTAVATEIIEQRVKTILTGNDSPDINFDLSINPYRGCEHGCIYCFARPTHSYFNLSPGIDFEARIFAKVNAAERLRAALQSPAYEPLMLNIGSATDAYQPAERRLGITRSVIEVLAEFKHPFSVITKSSGIERDIDLIAPMAAERMAAAYVSITTLDDRLARILEPRAARPERRLKTIERLSQAGVPVGVSVSPVIPFINEPEIERILEAAAQAGARHAFSIVLRLPWEVNPLFQQWLEVHFPERAKRVMSRIRDMRGGKDYDARFGTRMTGQGIWADMIRQRFQKTAARLKLNEARVALDLTRFVRSVSPRKRGHRDSEPPAQRSLF